MNIFALLRCIRNLVSKLFDKLFQRTESISPPKKRIPGEIGAEVDSFDGPEPKPKRPPTSPIVRKRLSLEKFKFTARARKGDQQAHPFGWAVKVWYATNRNKTLSTEPDSFYGGDRAALKYGRGEVHIPPNHKIGKFERPRFIKLEWKENVEKHIVVSALDEIEEQLFFHEVGSAQHDGGARPPILVFVHGFRVSFADAIRRTAQLAFDLFRANGDTGPDADLAVVPILFSWPSNGPLAIYSHDASNAEAAASALADFLLNLRSRTGSESIVLVSHSMGCRALAYALGHLDPSALNYPLAKDIVFAAPDIDRDVFLSSTDKIGRLAKRITLYASNSDKALLASKVFNGYPRAGDGGGGIAIFDSGDSIDATSVGGDIFAHSYFARATVLGDLYSVIANDAPPEKRFGLQSHGSPPRVFWEIRAQ